MSQELKNRKSNIRNLFDEYGVDAILLACNMSLLYVSGRIISGYIYLSRDADLMFVKRPNNLKGDGIYSIRKPEQIQEILTQAGIGPVGTENSWIVNSDNLEKITLCPDEIIEL